MKKNTVKLFVNNPMGRRCETNMRAAREARGCLGVEVVIIEKGSDEYFMESSPPPCPSVAVNGRFIVKDGTVDFEQLKAEIPKNAKLR